MTHTMVPCGHCYCGECLAGWLATKKLECPSCRVKSTAAPVRQHAMDNMVEVLAKSASEDDLEARKEKIQSWEANKQQYERQLAAPWSKASSRAEQGGGGRGGPGAGSGILSALAASILGGGGMGMFGADPGVMGGDAMMLMNAFHPAGAEVPGWGGGGARMRRMPAVVPPPQRAVAAAPPQHEFRVELSPEHSTARCAGCSEAIGELTTRVGMRAQAQSRQEAGRNPIWRWYHLNCLHPAHWHEARLRGVTNMRSIPAAEQARVRQHLQLAPR